jgi:hypothetical protein
MFDFSHLSEPWKKSCRFSWLQYLQSQLSQEDGESGGSGRAVQVPSTQSGQQRGSSRIDKSATVMVLGRGKGSVKEREERPGAVMNVPLLTAWHQHLFLPSIERVLNKRTVQHGLMLLGALRMELRQLLGDGDPVLLMKSSKSSTRVDVLQLLEHLKVRGRKLRSLLIGESEIWLLWTATGPGIADVDGAELGGLIPPWIQDQQSAREMKDNKASRINQPCSGALEREKTERFIMHEEVMINNHVHYSGVKRVRCACTTEGTRRRATLARKGAGRRESPRGVPPLSFFSGGEGSREGGVRPALL